jgi:hypothetical protein
MLISGQTSNKHDVYMSPIDKMIPQRRCEKCDAEMTHLGDVTPSLDAVPTRVFRCYNCNHVVSESC